MVEQAIIINLASRPERRESALKQFERLGLPFAPLVFPAIDLRRSTWQTTDIDNTMTPGAYGCAVSHWAAVAFAAATGKTTLILEDDFIVPDGFCWGEILPLPEGADVVSIGHCPYGLPFEQIKWKEQGDRYGVAVGTAALHAYIVVNPGPVLRCFEDAPHSAQIDTTCVHGWRSGRIRWMHSTKRHILHDDSSASSIQAATNGQLSNAESGGG